MRGMQEWKLQIVAPPGTQAANQPWPQSAAPVRPWVWA
jgi:hypothetical protein